MKGKLTIAGKIITSCFFTFDFFINFAAEKKETLT